jgi:hypothetical protein
MILPKVEHDWSSHRLSQGVGVGRWLLGYTSVRLCPLHCERLSLTPPRAPQKPIFKSSAHMKEAHP